MGKPTPKRKGSSSSSDRPTAAATTPPAFPQVKGPRYVKTDAEATRRAKEESKASRPRLPSGRPADLKLQFDYEEIEELAAAGLTVAQIAEAMSCSGRTIYDRKQHDAKFAAAIKRGQVRMRARIAENLFKLADERDRTALIFLSKVHLRWREFENLPTGTLPPAQMAHAIREEMQKLDTDTADEETQDEER